MDRNKHLKRCTSCEMRNFGFFKMSFFDEFCSIFLHKSHELNILRTWVGVIRTTIQWGIRMQKIREPLGQNVDKSKPLSLPLIFSKLF